MPVRLDKVAELLASHAADPESGIGDCQTSATVDGSRAIKDRPSGGRGHDAADPNGFERLSQSVHLHAAPVEGESWSRGHVNPAVKQAIGHLEAKRHGSGDAAGYPAWVEEGDAGQDVAVALGR